MICLWTWVKENLCYIWMHAFIDSCEGSLCHKQATAQSYSYSAQCLLCWYNDIEIIITSEDFLTWGLFEEF